MRTGIKRIFSLVVACFLTLVAFSQNTQQRTDLNDSYESAMDLFRKEKYSAAQHAFLDYLEKCTQPIRCYKAEYYVAFSALELEQDRAEGLFEDFVHNYPATPEAKRAYYKLGNYYFENKNYEKAAEYYAKTDKKNLSKDEYTEARFNQAYSYFVEKDIDQAEPIFDEVKIYENAYTYAAHYYSGYIKFKKEKFDEALQDFNEAEKNAAYSTVVPYMKVQIYHHSQQYQTLVEYAESVLDNKNLSNKAEIVLLTGNAYFEMKNYKQAANYLSSYAKVARSADSEVSYRLGFSYYQLGEFEKAIENLKLVNAQNDTLKQYVSFYLGTSYLKTDNKPYAENAFEQAYSVKIDENIRQEALYNLVKVTYENEDYSKSIAYSEKYITEFKNAKNRQGVAKILSSSYRSTKNYTEAIAYLESLPSLDWDLKKVYQEVTYKKAAESYNRRQFPMSASLLDKSLSVPVDEELKYDAELLKADLYSIKGDPQIAQPLYVSVIAHYKSNKNIKYNRAYYGLGYLLFNQEKYESAKYQFKSFIDASDAEKDFLYPDALVRLADCYFFEKKYDLAVQKYNQAIELKVYNIDYAFYQRGIVLAIDDNKTEEAKNSFSVIVNKFPKSVYRPKAMYQIAKVDFENGNYVQSEKEFTTYIYAYPEHAFVSLAYLKRGISFYNQGLYNKALNDYDFILANYCSEKIATQALASAQQTLGRLNKTAEFNQRLDKFESCNPEIQELEKIKFQTAESFYRNLDNKMAVKSFTNFIDKYPDSKNTQEAYYYLADSYYSLDKKDSSIKYFEKVVEGGPEQHREKALLRLGKLTIEDQQYEKAKTYNHQLLEVVTSQRKQLEGLLGLMKAYYHTNELDTSLAYSKIVQQKAEGIGYIKNDALLYEAKITYQKGDVEQAIDKYITLINNNDEFGAQGNYELAELYNKEGKYAQSLELARELTKNFADYTDWVGKSFLLIAENYISLEEMFQAKATLTSLAENFPKEDIKKKAKARLAEISVEEEPPASDSLEYEIEEIDVEEIKSDSLSEGGNDAE